MKQRGTIISYTFKEEGVLFVHNRKCAGNSMRAALRFRRFRDNHQPIAKMRKYVSDEQWERAFKFSFIRNPWDRWVALYLFRFTDKTKKRNRRMVPDYHIYDTPDRFRHYTMREIEHRLDLLGQQHTLPPSYWGKFTLDGETNELDFIGKYENLVDDWESLCDQLELPRLKDVLRNVNPTPRPDRRHYTEYYDDVTRDAIAKLYKKDIEEFEYEF